MDIQHNQPHTFTLGPNSARRDYERSIMRSRPVLLTPAAREVINRAVTDHCAFRAWQLHAVNARSTHVHAVLRADGMDPEPVMSQLKAWCTRRLREAGHVTSQSKVWARHGSTRYINDQQGLEHATKYVKDEQDSADMAWKSQLPWTCAPKTRTNR